MGSPKAPQPRGQEPAAGRLIPYDLTLFVSGASELSARAVANASALCQRHLPDRHRLSIVDVHEARNLPGGRLIVAPSLVRNLPLPVRMIGGDLSQTDRVLRALDLPVVVGAPRAPG